MATQDVEVVIPTWQELLASSAATPEFSEAVALLAENNRTSPQIQFGTGNPPIKVLRVICGLLEKMPQLEVRNVEVSGASGCSDYRGTVKVNDGERVFHFAWDCAWKARQLGWKDHFGDADQIRAARTYGYRCFEHFEEIN